MAPAQSVFNTKSPVHIIAHLNVLDYVERYKAISDVRDCSLFDGVIVPSNLRSFSSNKITTCPFGINENNRVSFFFSKSLTSIGKWFTKVDFA